MAIFGRLSGLEKELSAGLYCKSRSFARVEPLGDWLQPDDAPREKSGCTGCAGEKAARRLGGA